MTRRGRLTQETVDLIHALRGSGMSPTIIGAKLGVDASTVHAILERHGAGIRDADPRRSRRRDRRRKR